MNFEGCTKVSRSKIVVVSEKRCVFALNNAHGKLIGTVQIDGCLIRGDRKRCDYVLEVGSPIESAVYIELKGKDVVGACEQLAATLRDLTFRHASVTRRCHIVATRVPKAGPKTQQLQQEFRRKNGVVLYISKFKGGADA